MEPESRGGNFKLYHYQKCGLVVLELRKPRYCPNLTRRAGLQAGIAAPSLRSGQALKVGATLKMGPHPTPKDISSFALVR
jgi:hypothetical protein